VLKVEGRGEIAVTTAVTALLLHQCAMDTGTDCSFVRIVYRVNGVYGCSYCSTVTSVCYGYRD